MGIPVMILGPSGGGKTYSARNLDPVTSLIVKTVNKPLPFRSANWKPWNGESGSTLFTDNYLSMKKIASNAEARGKSVVIFDDFQYLMANEFMRRAEEKGFDKFTSMGKQVWELIIHCQTVSPNTIFYFNWHTDLSDDGRTKAKTIGKLLDDKITVEGLFTIVLKTIATDGQYLFSTQTSGNDPVKAPPEMFESNMIDNDLSAVSQAIFNYYGITEGKAA